MSILRRLLPVFCIALLWLCLPADAHAAISCKNSDMGEEAVPSGDEQRPCAVDIDECADPNQSGLFGKYAFTGKIVACMQNSVRNAVVGTVANNYTDGMLGKIANYMTPITGAAILLSIVFFGMRVLAGEQEIIAYGAKFVLKLGFIYFYSQNMASIALDLFGTGAITRAGTGDGILNELINITGSGPGTNAVAQASNGVAYGNSPWHTIDSVLAQMMGFGANVTLAQGVLGLVGAAITSSINSPSAASGLFLPAISALLTTMLFFFDIVYTYLKVVIVLGFLLIISPFILPLALFYHTEHYLKKLIDIVVMCLILVAMLFAFANMSMQLLQNSSTQIMTDLGGDARVWGRMNQPISSLLQISDPNELRQEESLEDQQNKKERRKAPKVTPGMASNIVPFMSMATDQTFPLPSVDFSGAPGGDVRTVSKLLIDFAAMFMLSAVLKYMLTTIPELAQSVAGVLSGIGFHQSAPMKQRFQEAMHDFKFGAGAGVGGVVGGVAGGIVGNRVAGRSGSSIGGQLGGIAGAFGGIKLLMKG